MLLDGAPDQPLDQTVSSSPHLDERYTHDRNTAIRPQPQTMDLFPLGLFPSDVPSGTVTPNGLLGYGGEVDLDFSAIDLSFLSTYNTQVPFEVQTPVLSYPNPTLQIVDNTPTNLDDIANTDTSGKGIQNSIWRFVPVPGVGGYSDQTDLSVPAQGQIAGTPESLFDVRKRATSERLDAVARDKILAILFSQVRSHILPALSAFPSVMLLDNLIQFFLAGPTPLTKTWIHAASFNPKKARPELLLAMAAAGAVLTPDRSLRKLGFAMQEVVRNYAPTVWEADNTLVRDLEMSQAYMLQLAIGLWSGSSRKVEISESFQQPLLSMLRRGGRFKRSDYPILTFGPQDSEHVLEEKWLSWIEKESFKRLVYHLLCHDAQTSMSLLTTPAVSYSELELPLPAPLELWMADSATEWKRLYQAIPELQTTRIPSLTECVANPDLMHNNSTLIDLTFSCSSFLYAMWGMVWEYRRLTRLFHAASSRSTLWDSRLSLMTRYQELIKIFDYYRVSYENESVLLLEVILMHLHMSMEDVQHFCGLEGAEDLSAVHASIHEWACSKTARSAMWHAGQVVRTSKRLPPFHLRDFQAMSLFHASLAFWAFGLAQRMFAQGQGSGKRAASPVTDVRRAVYLDDEETSATYRYITMDRGIAAIRNSKPEPHVVLLSDLKSTITAMMELLAHGDSEPALPNSPLVEKLLHVMLHIRDALAPVNNLTT
ncbi:C6 transcription factor [Stagonosporopsis vannaccii]|nr:C6 transcription factor [Stagonosporopsis vannaccii]